jgi:osmotically-inducible protein OsmY
MRRGALAGVLLVVCGAALGATVLHEPIATAATPFMNVIVGNDATNPVPVAEQNRDGNGNVRVHEQGIAAVHEQGTANVNVTNGSIPVTGTVSVASATQRVMHVASNFELPKNFALNTGFQDTSDCRALAAFIKPGELSLDNSDVFIRTSVTGTSIGDQQGNTGGIRTGNVWYFASTGGVQFFAPKSELVIVNHDDDNPRTLDDAWLICQR